MVSRGETPPSDNRFRRVGRRGLFLMKLWIVVDRDRWGFSHNAVRAATAEDAAKLAGCRRYPDPYVEVVELVADGEPATLWCHDESPDTGEWDE